MQANNSLVQSVIYTLPFVAEPPSFAMALDESLFQCAIRGSDTHVSLRFYRFYSSCVTLGLCQRNEEWIRSLHAQSACVVRRPTGGGTVFHRESDLIYAIVSPTVAHPELKTAKKSYRLIHQALMNALEQFDLRTTFYSSCRKEHLNHERTVCFNDPVCDDLMLQGRKIAGAAERRTNGYVLHQGSIDVGALQELNPILEAKDVADAFAKCLAETLNLELNEPPAKREDLDALARELEQSKSGVREFPQDPLTLRRSHEP